MAARTVRQQVQFVHEEALVLRPGHVEAIWGEEVMDTLLGKDLSICQRGDIVNSSGLDRGAKSGLDDIAISKTIRSKSIGWGALSSYLPGRETRRADRSAAVTHVGVS